MSLTSMTGFARAVGAFGAWRWTVELKCVNAKGLDLRLRLPPAFDRIEAEAKTPDRQGARARDVLRHHRRATRGRRRHSAGGHGADG